MKTEYTRDAVALHREMTALCALERAYKKLPYGEAREAAKTKCQRAQEEYDRHLSRSEAKFGSLF